MTDLSIITHSWLKVSAIFTSLLFCSSAYADDAATTTASRIDASDIATTGCKAWEPEESIYSNKHVAAEATEQLWHVKYKDGTLSVTWINFEANCCTEGFTGWINTAEEGVLDINLRDNDGMCDCLCPYDVTTTFTEIQPGLYTLRFHTQSLEYFEVKAYLGETGLDWIFSRPEALPADGRVYSDDNRISGCKGNSYAPSADRMNAPSIDPIAWDVRYNGSNLEVTWVNINGNCATHGFENWMVPGENSSLDFYIDELYIPGLPSATCVCPYDVTASYSDINPGEYTLNFHHYDKIYSLRAAITDGMDEHYISSELTGVAQVTSTDNPMRIIGGDVLRCAADGKFMVEIIGSDGLTPLRINSDGPTEISLNTLPAGVYIARMVTTDGNVTTYRFSR